MAEAAALRRQFPEHLGKTPDTVIAFLQRQMRARIGEVKGKVVFDEPPTIPLYKQLEAMRQRVNKAVKRYALNHSVPFSHVHADLNRGCGDTLPTAGMETMERRLEILGQWEAKA